MRFLPAFVVVIVFCASLSSTSTPAKFRSLSINRRLLGSLVPKTVSDDKRHANSQAERPSVQTLQSLLLRRCQHWNSHTSKYSRDQPPDFTDANSGPAEATAQFDVAELVSQLIQVISLSTQLLLPRSGCPAAPDGNATDGIGNQEFPHGPCPALAPELSHPRVAAFLADITHRYPSGPSSPSDLEAWAGAAVAFLNEHKRGMRAQREEVTIAEAVARVERAKLRAAKAAEAAARAAKTAAGKAAGGGGSRLGGKDGAAVSIGTVSDGTRGQDDEALDDSDRDYRLTGGDEGQHRRQEQHQQQEELQMQPGKADSEGVEAGFVEAGGMQAITTGGESSGMDGTVVSDGPRAAAKTVAQFGRPAAAGAKAPSTRRLTASTSVGDLAVASQASGAASDAGSAPAAAQSDGGELGQQADYVRQSEATRSRSVDPSSDPAVQSSAQSSDKLLGGLPIIRRVLLAQLLLCWLGPMERQLSLEAAEPLTAVVTKLYDLHVESVVQRATVEYFHISKTAGTSWTAAAGASGCARVKANGGRLRELDDDCRWLSFEQMQKLGVQLRRRGTSQVCSRYGMMERASVATSCAARLDDVRQRGFQFISNEYTLHGGRGNMYDTHICQQFVNVITIREPLERLVSNIKYILVRLSLTLFKPPKYERFQSTFCDAPVSLWEQYAPPIVDNYNIRTLIGERAFHSPLYGIGEAHEILAKQLLMQYDLILDLGSGTHAADLVMRSGLGWEATLADVRIWTLERHASRSGLTPEACRLGDLTPLLMRQQRDQRWYRFGQTLSRLDQLFLALARQLGLSPWPVDWADWELPPPPPDGATIYPPENYGEQVGANGTAWRHCGIVGVRRWYSNTSTVAEGGGRQGGAADGDAPAGDDEDDGYGDDGDENGYEH